jgi:hypothetical protein
MLPTGISATGIDIAIRFMVAGFSGRGGLIAVRRAGRAKRPPGGDGVTRATKERRERGAQPPLRPRVPRAPARDFLFWGFLGLFLSEAIRFMGLSSPCATEGRSLFLYLIYPAPLAE